MMEDTLAAATVLFVDDEPHVVQGYAQALRKEPYRIVTATSGAAGLEILEAASIDVVVSDERMPGMTGSEFLARACERYPDTMRIMLTGQASLESAIRAINEGEIFRFLTKPCDPLDLAQTIRHALQVRDLARQGSRLLATVRRQRTLLAELESEHPGISEIRRTREGAIVIDENEDLDVNQLLREIAEELDGRSHQRSPSPTV